MNKYSHQATLLHSPGLEFKFAPLHLGKITKSGEFEGYASLFGTLDFANDIVEQGAFKNSLMQAKAGRIKMLYQHDPAALIGSWDLLREDSKGLYARGRLLLGLSKAREAFKLIKNGALDGLSIGFKARRATKDLASGIRRLIDIDLHEISLVTFPLHPAARIISTKHFSETERMDASKSANQWIVSSKMPLRRKGLKAIVRGTKSARTKPSAQPSLTHQCRLKYVIWRAAKILQSK